MFPPIGFAKSRHRVEAAQWTASGSALRSCLDGDRRLSDDVGLQQPGWRRREPTWTELASDYEQARSWEDSLDRLVEWPAQRDMLGDVTGLTLLDAGCGSGAKIAQLVQDGAVASVGVDISDNFVNDAPSGLELTQSDLSDLAAVKGLAGRSFDRILFLQSFGYQRSHPCAQDGTGHAQRRRVRATDPDPANPVRHRTRRGERTMLGEEYFSTGSYSYRHRNWNEGVTLTKRPYTMSDLLNIFSAAGMWVETTIEPQMSRENGER